MRIKINNFSLHKTKNFLKKAFKYLQKLLNRFQKREPHLFFYSYKVALKKLTTKCKKKQKIELKEDLINKILIEEDVFSYPLVNGKNSDYRDYSGGLISSINYKLIDEAVFWRNGFCQEIPIFNPEELCCKNLTEIQYPLLFGGILFNHFGHFLLESLGRLWAYDFVKEIDPYIFFYTPWGDPDYLERDNFVNQVLTGFGIPLKKIVFIKSLAKINKVLIPIQKYGHGYMTNPDAIFLNFIRSFKFKHDTPKGFENADKIYVSRSKMPIDSGKPIAENFFEEYVVSNGYKVFYPEKFSLFGSPE